MLSMICTQGRRLSVLVKRRSVPRRWNRCKARLINKKKFLENHWPDYMGNERAFYILSTMIIISGWNTPYQSSINTQNAYMLKPVRLIRMLPKFLDTRYNGWDYQTKMYSIFFKNLISAAMHDAMPLLKQLVPFVRPGWFGYVLNSPHECLTYIFRALKQGTLQLLFRGIGSS